MRRMGLSNPRKPGKRSNKNKEERVPQPLVTPAQRILQQQWLQTAAARETVKLPRDALLPAPKKAKIVSVEDDDSLTTIFEKTTVMPRLVSPVESDVVETEVVGDVHQPANAAMENVVEMAPTASRGVDQPSQDNVEEEDDDDEEEEEEGPEKQTSASQEAEDKQFRQMVQWKEGAMRQIEMRTKNIAFLEAQLEKEREAKKKWEKRVAAYQELFG